MEHSELLRWIVGALEETGIPYLVTGSTATIFYGEPRFTADIDVVVELTAEGVPALLARFPAEEFYADEESTRRAVTRRGQFNIIHPASGLKVDVIVASGDDFDRSRFARARRVHPDASYSAAFASPEDVILRKLLFYREGGSDKHLRDVAGVLKISGQELDRDYLGDWADRLGVADLWSAVQSRVFDDREDPRV